MHPEAERLAAAFIKNFWAFDHEVRWLSVEQELSLWLDERTLLVGKRDAKGMTPDGDIFFADWKTGSKGKARYIDREKFQWRMNPQALTYGVLGGEDGSRFTVRWALKTEPARTDFEWYSYTPDEMAWWRGELIFVAEQIRSLRERIGPQEQWPLNLHYCAKYGENYACKFRDAGCWKLDFENVPPGMEPRTESHLGIENTMLAAMSEEQRRDLVVLDATRVADWMGCHELYRRLWEANNGLHEITEALQIGSDFHAIIAAHLNAIKQKQEAQ